MFKKAAVPTAATALRIFETQKGYISCDLFLQNLSFSTTLTFDPFLTHQQTLSDVLKSAESSFVRIRAKKHPSTPDISV